jgi:uncharacterized protein (DUF2236 family)
MPSRLTAQPLALPSFVVHRLDAAAGKIFAELGPSIDFSMPRGEPALVEADSVSWMIFKNQISLFIGGVSAVILEMAEPKVRDGVWQHSSFRTDAMKRLQRTGLAAMVTVYGGRTQAQAMIEGIVKRHSRVTGTTTEGEAYHANDPILLDWVQATAGFGFMEAYHAFVRPLSRAERDMLFAEASPAARLYGAVGAPKSQHELHLLFETMRTRLVPSPIVFEFLDIMKRVPALPAAVRPLQTILIKAAVDILPEWVREQLGLGQKWSLNTLERRVIKLAARANDRVVLPSLPAVQACRRLGLPDDYLYRRTQ